MSYKSLLLNSSLAMAILLGTAACGSSNDDTPAPSPEAPQPELNLLGQYVVAYTGAPYSIILNHTRSGVVSLIVEIGGEEFYQGTIKRENITSEVQETIRLFNDEGAVAGMATLNIEALNPEPNLISPFTLDIEFDGNRFWGAEHSFTTMPILGERDIELAEIKKDYMELPNSGHSYQWLDDTRLSFTSAQGCEFEGIVNKTGFKMLDEDMAASIALSQTHTQTHSKAMTDDDFDMSMGWMFDYTVTKSSCDFDSYSNAGMIIFAELPDTSEVNDMVIINVPSSEYLNTYIGASYR